MKISSTVSQLLVLLLSSLIHTACDGPALTSKYCSSCPTGAAVRDSLTPSPSSVFFKNVLFVQSAFAHWLDLRSALASFASKRDEVEPWQLKVKLLSAASPFWGWRAY